MRTHIAKMKAELKVLALEIKDLKPKTKKSFSVLDKTYPERHYFQWKIFDREEDFKVLRDTYWNNMSTLSSKCEEFRAKHIAYCLLRGRTLEQIEPKLRNPNSWHHTRVRKEATRIVASVLEAVNAQPKP